jgi:putative aldouronate transport system permease protein
VWSGTWQNIGWNTIIYLAALTNVSPELIEAAQIDGAKRHQIVWHVNLPSILPTVIILFIMATGSLLSVGYEKVLLMQNELNKGVAQVISTYVYDLGLRGGQFSYTTAIGLFNNVISVIILIVVNAITKKISEVSLW